MKRYRIYREGFPTQEENPRTIVPRGVQIPDEIPVLDRPRGRVVGKMTHLRRESGGWVTGTPEGFTLFKGFALAAAIMVDEDTDRDDVVGELRACHVTKGSVWPGMTQ